MDLKEQFIQNVSSSLLNSYSADDVNRITTAIILELSKYELKKTSNDIAIPDDSNEKLLKFYGSVLLTEGKSKKTVAGYMRFLLRFSHDISKSLSSVNVFDIRVWLATAQKSVSLSTCETYRAYLSAFYQWMEREEIIQKNPMAKIPQIKHTDEIKQPFSSVEIDQLRSSCKTLRERAELEVLLSSGARVSELCSLNKTDINFDTSTVLIRVGKGGKQRTTYISDVAKMHLIKYLKSRDDNNDSLFVTKVSERISTSSVEADLIHIGERSGVKDVHPHRCRRTFATSLSKKGMDIRSIQILMGHSGINTTMKYITLDSDHIKNEYTKCA